MTRSAIVATWVLVVGLLAGTRARADEPLAYGYQIAFADVAAVFLTLATIQKGNLGGAIPGPAVYLLSAPIIHAVHVDRGGQR
jgi:hypothetical protein